MISQTLCYALMFPPPATDTTEPTGINLERALGVAMFGLSVQQQQVSGRERGRGRERERERERERMCVCVGGEGSKKERAKVGRAIRRHSLLHFVF